jgi:hypothetical protein
MDNSRRNVDERTLVNFVVQSIKGDDAITLENVIKLCGTLVIMQAGTVNIDCVRPCGGCEPDVFAANEPVTPTAGAALARRVSLMPDKAT